MVGERQTIETLINEEALLFAKYLRNERGMESEGYSFVNSLTNHAILGAGMSDKILRELGYPEEKIERIKHCIASHRFRGENPPRTIEAKILSDADKLDILGATGIARSFTIGGENGQKIYSETPIDEYVKENLVGGKANGRIIDPSRHASNLEFETKFKQIPDRLYTQKAREIARERLEYMKQFFERLKREIDGQL
jgi:uncharacterized protein